MTAERARERLDRGLQALARAGDDPAILSFALAALHGALEAHFRSVLASDSRVPAEMRAVMLDPSALRFVDVANAMHTHLELPERERRAVLDAFGHHDAQSQGDEFTWDRAGLERYARYVAHTLGEPAPTLSQPIAAVPPTETATRPAAPASKLKWIGNSAGLALTRPYRATSPRTERVELTGSHFLVILAALVVVSLLWNRVESAALDAASRASETPVAVPSPPSAQAAPAVAVASPTAAPAPPAPAPAQSVAGTGQEEWLIVGNTGGEGVFLRRTPSMADRLEPFEDGTRMQVIGPDREAEGRRWKYVRVENGLVGWVPAEYLIPPPRR